MVVKCNNGDSQYVKECEGPADNCGGGASDYKEKYDTFTECCELLLSIIQTVKHLFDEDGNGGEVYSNKYFTNFETASLSTRLS